MKIFYEAYLSIGGNLGNRLQNIYDTHKLVKQQLGLIKDYSPIYISEPWGFTHKKYFLNQIIKIESNLSTEFLLKQLQSIEKELGRQKNITNNYQGRTVDIDIISLNNIIINKPEFKVPHPHLSKRLFVLLPLYDICPYWQHPIFNKPINLLIKHCPDKSQIRKLNCLRHE